MNRRGFAVAALVGGASGMSPALAAQALQRPRLQEDLFRAPEQWTGQRFMTQQGVPLILQQVHALRGDARLSQWRLEFSGAQPLAEGLHQLRDERGGQVEVFLQCNGQHATAVVSRLRQG